MALLTNLNGYWTCNNTVNDAHSSGNNLTNNNSTAFTGTGLVYAKAATFTYGSGMSLSRADNASLSTGDVDFTIAAWINLNSTDAINYALCGKSPGGLSAQDEYSLYKSSSNYYIFQVRDTNGQYNEIDCTSTPAQAGTWQLVIGWHDSVNNVIRIQVNNGTPHTNAHSTGVNDGTAPFRIGADGSGTDLEGLIGPVMFWKRVLTDAERTSLYNGGAGLTYALFGAAFSVTANAAMYTVSAQSATLTPTSRKILAGGAATFSSVAFGSGLSLGRAVTAGVGHYDILGQVASFDTTQSEGQIVVPARIIAAPSTGEREIDLSAEAIRLWGAQWNAPEAEYEFTGRVFMRRKGESGIYKRQEPEIVDRFTGQHYTITGERADYQLAAYTVTGAKSIAANRATYSISGQSASSVRTRKVVARQAVFAYVGQSANLSQSFASSDFVVTGSMSASAPRTVNLSSAGDAAKFPQASINAGTCFIIVPTISTETRGTTGPAGAFPYTRFASWDQANLHYNEYPEFYHVGTNDTGETWIKWSGWPFGWYPKSDWAGGRYYDAKILPRALVAKVVSKSGTTLTLDPAGEGCFQNVSLRTMYVDQTAIARAQLASVSNGGTLNWNDVFPGASSVPVADDLFMYQKTNVTLTCDSEGSFTFFTPPGAPSAKFAWYQCTGCDWQYFGLRGNHDHYNWGYGFGWTTPHGKAAWERDGYIDENNPSIGGAMRGVEFILSTDCNIYDCTIDYVNGKAWGTLVCSACYGFRVKHHNTAHIDYWQWQFMFNESDHCGTYDCEVHGEGPLSAYECYHSTDCFHYRPVGTNATFSYNAATNCRYGSDPLNPGLGGGEIRFTAGCMDPIAAAENHAPYVNADHSIIEVCNNTGHVEFTPFCFGNSVWNMRLIQEGYLTSVQHDSAGGVHVQDTQQDYLLDGLYYSAPNYMAPSTRAGPIILWSNGQNTTYRNLVCIGTARNSSEQMRNLFVVFGTDGGNNQVETHYP